MLGWFFKRSGRCLIYLGFFLENEKDFSYSSRKNYFEISRIWKMKNPNELKFSKRVRNSKYHHHPKFSCQDWLLRIQKLYHFHAFARSRSKLRLWASPPPSIILITNSLGFKTVNGRHMVYRCFKLKALFMHVYAFDSIAERNLWIGIAFMENSTWKKKKKSSRVFIFDIFFLHRPCTRKTSNKTVNLCRTQMAT